MNKSEGSRPTPQRDEVTPRTDKLIVKLLPFQPRNPTAPTLKEIIEDVDAVRQMERELTGSRPDLSKIDVLKLYDYAFESVFPTLHGEPRDEPVLQVMALKEFARRLLALAPQSESGLSSGLYAEGLIEPADKMAEGIRRAVQSGALDSRSMAADGELIYTARRKRTAFQSASEAFVTDLCDELFGACLEPTGITFPYREYRCCACEIVIPVASWVTAPHKVGCIVAKARAHLAQHRPGRVPGFAASVGPTAKEGGGA